MFKKLLDRIKEPSTHAGLATLLLGLGVSVEAAEVYAIALSGLFGAISMFLSERGKGR